MGLKVLTSGQKKEIEKYMGNKSVFGTEKKRGEKMGRKRKKIRKGEIRGENVRPNAKTRKKRKRKKKERQKKRKEGRCQIGMPDGHWTRRRK